MPVKSKLETTSLDKLREHISLKEVICPCGKCAPIINNDFLDRVEDARLMASVPFHFTSFFRCNQYNKKIGGASNSPHPMGIACDIATAGDRVIARKIFDAAVLMKFQGIELCTQHIHLDDMKRGYKVTWPGVSK
jgi:uncharacterized protein YcbK (DUF882 family)|tara:strand:- start:5558 stop:5962 length:405 start_codon:yes stop_codon:yes gene_type:complete